MRLTYRTVMGDYNTKRAWWTDEERRDVFQEIVDKLGRWEDEQEAMLAGDLSPLPFEEG
jgi:hypothetical protein